MTNSPEHFTLDAELARTRDWEDGLDDSAVEIDDDWTSGYADDDPEEDPTLGQQDLAERHALRRVAGLRTELEDGEA